MIERVGDLVTVDKQTFMETESINAGGIWGEGDVL